MNSQVGWGVMKRWRRKVGERGCDDPRLWRVGKGHGVPGGDSRGDVLVSESDEKAGEDADTSEDGEIIVEGKLEDRHVHVWR